MSLTDQNEARLLLANLRLQPEKFLFGLKGAIKNSVMALVTPLVKDGPAGKEYAQAHVIVNDVPGTGKTAMFNYLAASLDAKLGRMDGRPDLMPSDFTGREERDKFTGIRTLLKGPLHSNIFFADEINRTPPKSQSPMLGAMEGGKIMMNVTNEEEGRIESRPFPLYPISDDPNETRLFFIVFATMNPIEFEGTYPLSEAQMERFTYRFNMGAPSRDDEKKIRARNVVGKKIEVVMNLSELLDIHKMVAQIELSEQANELMMRYLQNSRPHLQDEREFGKIQKRFAANNLIQFVNEYVVSGCSRRRNFHMEAAAKARAFMRGENELATVDDVKAIAHITMEHVIQLDPKSIGDNITAHKVVESIIRGTMMP